MRLPPSPRTRPISVDLYQAVQIPFYQELLCFKLSGKAETYDET